MIELNVCSVITAGFKLMSTKTAAQFVGELITEEMFDMGVRFTKQEIMASRVDKKKQLIYICSKDEFFDWVFEIDACEEVFGFPDTVVYAKITTRTKTHEYVVFHAAHNWGLVYEGNVYRNQKICVDFPYNYTFPHSLRLP